MSTNPSFAPLAARLTAQAAELRPVDGSRDTLAKLAALVMCALLDMLICVCALLDARAAAGLRPMEARASRDDKAACVPFSGARCQAPVERRTLPRSLVPGVRVVVPRQAAASERAEATPAGPWLAWSSDPAFVRVGPAPSVAAPPRKTTFPSAPTHGYFVTLS